MCDGNGITETSGSGHEGVRRLHVHANGDFERLRTVDCRLWGPLPNWPLLLHGGKTSVVTKLLRCATPRCVQGLCPDATSQQGGPPYRTCDPCACTVDSRSGGVKVPFNGCTNHSNRALNGNLWCYVAGGTACKAAHADLLLPGSAWKPCSDPNCQCVQRSASANDVTSSGTVAIQASQQGCDDHDGRGYEWCWIRAGTGCPTAKPATDPGMKTAAWQSCRASACDCVLERSDLPDKAVPLGCARHFSETLEEGDVREVCYVKGGMSCMRDADSDSIIPDTAWRYCLKDCYGVGTSFAPETRAACSCFNESKPGTIHILIELRFIKFSLLPHGSAGGWFTVAGLLLLVHCCWFTVAGSLCVNLQFPYEVCFVRLGRRTDWFAASACGFGLYVSQPGSKSSRRSPFTKNQVLQFYTISCPRC